MSEFVFNRPTLVAVGILTLLLGFLTFSAGVLSGVTWVQRMTPAERQAWRGDPPRPAPPGVGVESAAWGGAREVRLGPQGSRAPAGGNQVATTASVAGERAAPAAPAAAEPDVLASASAARPRGWVRIGRLDWRRADEVWATRELARYPHAAGLDFAVSHPVPPTPYGELIYDTARRHAVNPLLVAAVIRVESNFDPRAVSAKGARGLMQLMPETASRFGFEPSSLDEPEVNLEAGVRYLAWLGRRFGGDLPLVLSGYNAGHQAVERYGGVPPFPETRAYVDSVLAHLGTEAKSRSAD